MQEPSASEAYIARQPILDSTGQLFAYELLFRGGPGNQAGALPDAMKATAQVLDTALNNIGVRKLVGPHKAFINCSRELLLSDLLHSLDPQRFVIEVLETVQIDGEVVQAVQALHQLGFEIALDDFVFSVDDLRRSLPLLPYIRYIKIDLIGNSPQKRSEAARLLKAKGKIMLAEKVETEDEHRHCHQQGYELFQGYYFAKPEMLSTRKVDPRTTSILQVLQVLRRDPELSELEAAFKRHPELTLSLLRYINSVAIGLRSQVSSIRQALALVGQRKLSQWLTIMLYARSDTGVQGIQSPLFENAVQRARFLEDLARHLDPQGALADQAFLAGILSRMDALCRVPMQNILSEFDLGIDIRKALLEGQGRLGDLLTLVSALESGGDEVVGEALAALRLEVGTLRQSLGDSYAWQLD